jgi:RNA:NAD 2'-phosphotransferase (TPT1/KptA family)
MAVRREVSKIAAKILRHHPHEVVGEFAVVSGDRRIYVAVDVGVG